MYDIIISYVAPDINDNTCTCDDMAIDVLDDDDHIN